jgi:hypothetical protein
MQTSILNRLIVIAVLLLGSRPVLSGQDYPLDSAAKLIDLTSGESSPFEMDGDFTAQINTPLEGHFIYRWKSKTEWWRKITLGGFEQVEVFRGDTRYILRNASFEPERVTELKGLLWHNRSYDNVYASNQKKRKLNGIEVSCIQTKNRKSGVDGPEVCIDPVSNQIVSEAQKGAIQELRRLEFTDYISLGSHQFPSQLKLREGASVVLSAHITSLKAAEFDDALLTPPHGAIERRECQGIKPPFSIHRPSIGELVVQGSGGITSLSITIGTDGSVTDAHLIGRSTKEMDEKVLKSLHEWKFQPAMCGNEPVVSDMMISIGISKQVQ